MSSRSAPFLFLDQEARALLTRLSRIRPFSLQMPMVPAACVSNDTLSALERFMAQKRRSLNRMIGAYRLWIRSGAGASALPSEAQRRFTIHRVRFNSILSQFDIFADVLNQRSENDTGVWLAGLDAVARDALALPGYYTPPPVICYLDRGQGAAIRRARTRLPGGDENPVAIIRVPRERMIGNGIASSLIHEVGHQGSALLDLQASLRPVLKGLSTQGGSTVWLFYDRWIGEILADFWALARIGIASTEGLISVVSLPRPFVFRFSFNDPHPFPWIRVKLSCAMGKALYPHPQWDRLSRMWDSLYPPTGLTAGQTAWLGRFLESIPAFVTLLVNHRPRSLRGKSLAEALASEERGPDRLRFMHDQWRARPGLIASAAPSLVFAVIGQAKADNRIMPEEESRLLSDLLRGWALRGSFPDRARPSPVRTVPSSVYTLKNRKENPHATQANRSLPGA